MPAFRVIRKADQVVVFEYTAAAAIEWVGFEFAAHDHIEQPDVDPPQPEVFDPTQWRIHVGPFFDRFGDHKLEILASTDPLVQAVVKDATVRKYIALQERRAELMQAIQLLQSKGFALDPEDILDTPPTPEELYRG